MFSKILLLILIFIVICLTLSILAWNYPKNFSNYRQLLGVILPSATTPSKIMIIVPHEDDEAVGTSGKIMQNIRDGGNVFVVYITDGAPGCEDCNCWNEYGTCRDY
ncbi:MAG: PIG-L family deacetylase, partial [Candidatus Aenigmarchaeota archaeon]|nr:PIG-L family deacetylase [Candidatus Aenigmarchaeota archaeon]